MSTDAGSGALEHPSTLEEARAWAGRKLDDVNGSTAGRVEGVLVDAESGEPSWLVIRIGLLGRRSAIPFELAVGGPERVWVPLPREVIRSAPEVDPAAGLEAGQEAALCSHFEIPEGSGRAAAIAGREPGAAGSVPA